ncbi:MAG: hypothetical protein AAFX76_00595, partial [Planctomycetota bacterium]
RGLARVSARYLKLASQQLADGSVPEDRSRSHVETVRLTATVLEFSHNTLRASGLPPQGLDRLVDQRNWNGVLDIANDWTSILTQAPYNFSEQEIAAPVGSPRAAAP